MVNNEKIKFSLKKDFFWVLALTIFFAVNMNYDWHAMYLTWYGSLCFILAGYFLTFGGRLRLENPSFFIWLASFIAIGIVSICWGLSASVTIDVIKSFIICYVVLFLIQSSINFGFDFVTLLQCYLIATMINAIYVVAVIDVASLGVVQLGAQILEGWNGNGIGFMMAQGALIGCYLFKKTQTRRMKLGLLASILFLFFLTAYTGSRTAFVMLMVEVILYFCFSHPSKIARNILISSFALFIAFYLVMNVESFYNVLGSRFEGLFALFSGEGEVDNSSNVRNAFIENGKKWFSERPLFGYGMNNYKVLNQTATGKFTYAHNTFIELAVDLGVLGLVWYYSVYVFLVFRLWRSAKNNPMNVFLLSALIASLVSQYGTVSYYGFYQNFLLMLCFFAINKAHEKTILDSNELESNNILINKMG